MFDAIRIYDHLFDIMYCLFSGEWISLLHLIIHLDTLNREVYKPRIWPRYMMTHIIHNILSTSWDRELLWIQNVILYNWSNWPQFLSIFFILFKIEFVREDFILQQFIFSILLTQTSLKVVSKWNLRFSFVK